MSERAASAGGGLVEVVRAGALTTVQDAGRFGYAHLGVPVAGPIDGPALRRANRLVGNPPGAAGLEITLSGCRLRPRHATIVAVTGAGVSRLRVDGQPAVAGVPVAVPAGAVLDIGPARTGVRTYVAVAGGIDVAPVLGSRATDTLCGLGPPVLRDGDVLPVGAPTGSPTADRSSPAAHDSPAADPLRFTAGPRADWFTAAALDTLSAAVYTVSMRSNRVAARLDGPALERAVPGELPSEGLVLGAIQVPASGQPLVFLADHPTTGGYPVIGVVEPADLPRLGQCRPGAAVRFARVE
jgi:biotin-dependent carboxylase-like uncharacterized protein